MKKVRTLSVIMVVALLFISCGYSNEDTDKHSHEYIESVTAPTCTERGYTTYTCGICGDYRLTRKWVSVIILDGKVRVLWTRTGFRRKNEV